MAKKVIIVNSGENRVFETLEEASREVGVNPSTLSRAINEAGEYRGMRLRYGDRVFVLRLKGRMDWVVATENSRRTGYIVVGDPARKLSKREVAAVKDITASWYYGSLARDLQADGT